MKETMRERVIGEIAAHEDSGHFCYTNQCVLADRILALVAGDFPREARALLKWCDDGEHSLVYDAIVKSVFHDMGTRLRALLARLGKGDTP